MVAYVRTANQWVELDVHAVEAQLMGRILRFQQLLKIFEQLREKGQARTLSCKDR